MTNRPASGDKVNRLRSNSGDSIQPRLFWPGARAPASFGLRSSRPEDTPPDQGFAIPARSVAFIRGAPFDCLRGSGNQTRSEEHTSELQSRGHLVCRLLLEKKK